MNVFSLIPGNDSYFLPVMDFVIHRVVVFNKEKNNTKTSRFPLPIPQVAVKIYI
jgi:hypothetical protein